MAMPGLKLLIIFLLSISVRQFQLCAQIPITPVVAENLPANQDCVAVDCVETPNTDKVRDTNHGKKPSVDRVSMNQARPEDCGFDKQKLDRVIKSLQGYVNDGKIPGAVIGIARGNQLVMQACVGYRDMAKRKPMEKDTIFRIYSMTKPITTVAALMLVDEGKLELDAPLAKYLPEFATTQVFKGMQGTKVITEPLQRPITIRDLLRHTAGMTYGIFGNTPVDKLYKSAGVLSHEDDAAALSIKISSLPTLFQPGSEFHYSIATDIVGRVIEVVSGQKLDAYLRNRIFAPLGMHDTGFHVPAKSLDRFSTSYRLDQAGQLHVTDEPETSEFRNTPPMLSGGDGLVSTLMDYLRFTQMLRNGGTFQGTRLLSASSVKEMTENQLPENAVPISIDGNTLPDVAFGLGVSVYVGSKKMGSVPLLGEYGWDGMATTSFWSSPASDTTVVLLTQVIPYSPTLSMTIRPLVYDAITE